MNPQRGRTPINPENIPKLIQSLEPILWIFFAAASCFVVYKLGRLARVVLLLQLIIVSVLCQYWLWQSFGVPPHAFHYLVSVLSGAAIGAIVRALQDNSRRAQSRRMEILARNRELIDVKLQLVKQAEIDRRLLAADLHDQVLNDLKAIDSDMSRYFDSQEPELATTIKTNLEKAQSEIREVMDNLSPVTLQYLGLSSGIEYCLRRGSERGQFKGKVRNKLKNDELNSLSTIEQTLLYRLIQESITNICKHAAATNVTISVDKDNDDLVLKITDDGAGIDLDKINTESRGVRYMRQRADLIGATIAWRRGENNKGTTVEIRMQPTGQQNGEDTDR